MVREEKADGGGIENNPPLFRDLVSEKLTPPPSSEGPITETVAFSNGGFS